MKDLFVMNVNSCEGIYDSLDVRFTKNCDNNCSFCIEKDGLPLLTMAPISELIERTIESNISNVLILGGEPFLYPDRLLEYVSGIKPFVKSIYITTSLPKTFITEKNTVNMIMGVIDGLNVSIQSTDFVKNNEILNASSEHDRITVLRNLCHLWNPKIRVNLNLCKSGINTRTKLIKTLLDLHYNSVKTVKINELQNADEEYISYEDIMNIKMPSPYACGCQTRIYVNCSFAYEMNLWLKRSCFFV